MMKNGTQPAMNKRIIVLVGGALLMTGLAFGHVHITPVQSMSGATETYRLRVPSEGGRTTTSVVLAVPDGMTIASISSQTGVTHDEKRMGDRIAEITWMVEIKAGESAELSFVARNPTDPLIIWKVTQKYSDGSSSAWVGPPRDRSPAPITKLGAETSDTNKFGIPDTSASILKKLKGREDELAKTITDKKLDDVHHHAFAIRDLVNVLPDESKDLAADKLSKLKANAKFVASLADRLDKSGDANDQAGTESNLKKLQAILKEIRALYPDSMTKDDPAAVQYTCPMHPEVVQDKPGNCPKCGMKLVPKK